jgi:hypothetical protein
MVLVCSHLFNYFCQNIPVKAFKKKYFSKYNTQTTIKIISKKKVSIESCNKKNCIYKPTCINSTSTSENPIYVFMVYFIMLSITLYQ